MRRNTPIKQKQGHKQSSSVLALMTNYPSSSKLGVATSIDLGSSHDGNDRLQSKTVDGKRMIKLDPEIRFSPPGCWHTIPNFHAIERFIQVTTTFNATMMSIDCSSAADYFQLQCTGVESLRVKFREDMTDKNMSQSMAMNGARRFSRNVRSHEDDIPISSEYKAVGDPREEVLQEFGFRSPWPCCHVEVHFVSVTGQFIAVLKTEVYGESLPSGLSTPIDTQK